MRTDDHLGEVWVSGGPGRTELARGRLEYAAHLAEARRLELAGAGTGAKYVGDTFRVHVQSGAAALVDDGEIRGWLELIAEHGERVGVVILVHGTPAHAAESFAGSGILTAALAAGRTVRMIEPGGAPGLSAPPRGDAERAVDALLVAVRLVVGIEPAELRAATEAALAADSTSARAALSAALFGAAAFVAGDQTGEPA